MEVTLILLGATILIASIAWFFRTSERLENLDRQVDRLREQLATLQSREIEKARSSEKETPEPAQPPAGRKQDQFSTARERAAESASTHTEKETPPTAPAPAESEMKAPERVKKTEPPAPPPIPVITRPPSPAAPEPARAPVAEESAEEPEFSWRPFLEKIKLWPPSGENAEAAMFSWWLTRLGIVFFVIASVFLGIRFSDKIPPALWVLTLAGIASGLTTLGSWLEKRLEGFGRVITAGGLGLFYFTSFASFAIPAMKIIHDPVTGVLVQGLVLALIVGWSFWKRDESFGALAIFLGFVSCGFSHHHDLENFVIAGLLLLAAAGGVMLVLRNWIWPHGIATIGSWGGFLILATGKWSVPDQAPAFGLILGCLLLLAVILEAANFLAHERGRDDGDSRPRERRALSLLNTSAAITVGWIATRSVAPEYLDVFFLSFAILMLAITLFRYWRKHPDRLTETFFLKAVALLALFFVERFEGPTRWLSLAIEAGFVLWTYRRTGFRWIEIGFTAVFLGALGFIWKDVLSMSASLDSWPLLGVPSFAGAATLVLLSVQLAFHSLWSAEAEADRTDDDENPDPVAVFRLLAAAMIGFAAAAFVGTLATANPEVSRTLYLTAISLALAAPAVFIRRFPPILAGLAALVPAYLGFLRFPFESSTSSSGILTAAWLTLLAFGLAEIAFRFWEKRWHCGNATRTLLSVFGLLSLTELISRVDDRLEFDPAAAVPALLLFAAACVPALAGLARRFTKNFASGGGTQHLAFQWLTGILAGCLSVYLAFDFLGNHAYLCVWLALSGAVLFTAAIRARNHVPAGAGAIPFFIGILVYAAEYTAGSNLNSHLLSAILLATIALGISLVLWRFVNRGPIPEVRGYELILQASALFVIHWVFRSHLDASAVFFADALLAAAATAGRLLAPFRLLPALSSLPLALAIIHAGATEVLNQPWGAKIFWWPAATLVFGWVWFLYSPKTKKDPVFAKRPFHFWNSAVAAVFLTIAGYHALDAPWHLIALSGFALVLAGLWRWERIAGLHAWSLLPLGVAAVGALLRITGTIPFDGEMPMLIASSLTALAISGHGLVIGFRNPGYRPLMWAHALAALTLIFLAYSPGALGVSNFTTVCWGSAAIAVFVIGLIAGLRPYRLSGLIGIGICIVRLFLIDIEDPLYRIFAFFLVAVVLLVAGYLYHRLRHLVERTDNAGESQA